MKICFATNNPNKLREIQQILGEPFEVISLKELGCFDEIPEPYETLEENSETKARHVYDRYQIPVFADDSGLEVKALSGAPGVHTAYYGGPERSADKNMEKLLQALEGETDRQAQFRAVMTYIDAKGTHQFEGIVKGEIAQNRAGTGGFGYDPVFQPEGYTKTFAQLPDSVKNEISHRGRSLEKLVLFLKSKNK